MQDKAGSKEQTPSAKQASPWRWLGRVLTLGFFLLIAALLIRNAQQIEWSQIGTALRRYQTETLALALFLALLSHLLHACFDLLGRAYTGHGLRTGRVMSISFVSYAFSLNLGALVGGAAFRYRLYSRFGLDGVTITRIYSLSILTNWVPYLGIAGTVLLWWPPQIGGAWKVGSDSLPWFGALFLLLAMSYLLLCTFSQRRSWQWRSHELNLPSLRLALTQIGVAGSNWLLMAGVIFVLLPEPVGYAKVLGILLISAVAAALVHVPAGLGVIEAVFILMLRGEVSQYQVLAALFAYRGIYYLVPLLAAAPIYFSLEARAKRQHQ